jgi:Predicted membrane protein (DUF2207)
MPDVSDAPAYIYQLAWISVGVVCAYYAVATVVLHWSSRRSVGVTRYEPPQGISPGVAAYLMEGGRCERAFAAAVISLAAKGYLEIRQKKDWFVLEKLREPDGSLPLDESVILTTLFFPPSIHTYKFNGRDYDWICKAYEEFCRTVEGIADPSLISGHSIAWWCGQTASWMIIVVVAASLTINKAASPLASIAYLGFWILIGGSSLVAALRVWPATLRKLISFLPGNKRPRRPLDLNDAVPVILIAPIFLGFSFLTYLTSLKFVLLAVGLIVMNFVFRHLLEAPTEEGRKVIAELDNFKEFLSRADADRLNRENQPGETPAILEKYSAFAVALDVEHAWGEEFTGNLLELLQIDQAYAVKTPRISLPDMDDDIIELNIDPRK